MRATVELRFRQNDWARLNDHLFPDDGDEHGAALLCGMAGSDDSCRLLVREVVVAVDGVDYTPGVQGYRHLSGAFVTRQIRRAKDLGLVYLAVHNHGGGGPVAFSTLDMGSHERAYPTLTQVSGNAVGGLVLSRGAVAGDVWFPGGNRLEVVTTIVGDVHRKIDARGPLANVRPTAEGVEPTFVRQALIFGAGGQEVLNRMRVGIIGVGGIGMLLAQSLSRLGVGHLVVVDPDRVSPSNLSRLPEATRRDAHGWLGGGFVGRLGQRLGLSKPTRKVDLARRIIRRANPAATVKAIAGDVADDKIARQLTTCDFIFLAADTMLARDVINQLSYQYLIPVLQVGSKVVIDKSSGSVLDVFGVVRSLGTEAGCLRCNGLIDIARLTEEAVGTEEQRQNQRYVDDPDVAAPSVITINAMSAGWAANDFMHYATGLGRPATGFRILRARPPGPGIPQLVVQMPDGDPGCHVCGSESHSAAARGDSVDMPTRI